MERNISETMTTNTPSQAASIDSPEFRQLLKDYVFYGIEKGLPPVIAYIDAKLAQAHLEKQVAEMAAEVEARDRDEWKARATAAESRLAEIQRGAEGLTHYIAWDGNICETQAGNHPERVYVKLDKVLALLAPQGQSDTSGLPG